MPLTHIIICDIAGCQNEAEWVITNAANKTTIGSRFCDSCKRDIVAFEKEVNQYQRTQFRHEKKRFGA